MVFLIRMTVHKMGSISRNPDASHFIWIEFQSSGVTCRERSEPTHISVIQVIKAYFILLENNVIFVKEMKGHTRNCLQ